MNRFCQRDRDKPGLFCFPDRGLRHVAGPREQSLGPKDADRSFDGAANRGHEADGFWRSSLNLRAGQLLGQ